MSYRIAFGNLNLINPLKYYIYEHIKSLLEMLCWSGAKGLDLKPIEVNRTLPNNLITAF